MSLPADRELQPGDVMVTADGHVSVLKKRVDYHYMDGHITQNGGWRIDCLMSPDGQPKRERGVCVPHQEDVSTWKRLEAPGELGIGFRYWYRDAIYTRVMVGPGGNGSTWRRHDGSYHALPFGSDPIFVGLAPDASWTAPGPPSERELLLAARERIKELEAEVQELLQLAAVVKCGDCGAHGHQSCAAQRPA